MTAEEKTGGQEFPRIPLTHPEPTHYHARYGNYCQNQNRVERSSTPVRPVRNGGLLLWGRAGEIFLRSRLLSSFYFRKMPLCIPNKLLRETRHVFGFQNKRLRPSYCTHCSARTLLRRQSYPQSPGNPAGKPRHELPPIHQKSPFPAETSPGIVSALSSPIRANDTKKETPSQPKIDRISSHSSSYSRKGTIESNDNINADA